MKQLLIALALLFASTTHLIAASNDSIAYHHHETDTAVISKIITATRNAQLSSPAQSLAFVASKLVNSPYVAATLEGDTELLRINMSQFDCTTLVETAIALALTANVDTASIDDFAHNLRNIRYRGGVIDGYASRLHYVSDWIADNASRGYLTEVTSQIPCATRNVIDINYISSHRRSYPALLNNDSLLASIKEVEKKYIKYRHYYIPSHFLNREDVLGSLQNGDIILFTSSSRGLDVAHMGIVVIDRGRACLIHASSKAHAVILDRKPLYNYLQGNNAMTGIRVVRLSQ